MVRTSGPDSNGSRSGSGADPGSTSLGSVFAARSALLPLRASFRYELLIELEEFVFVETCPNFLVEVG